jgi:hypothetical protein
VLADYPQFKDQLQSKRAKSTKSGVVFHAELAQDNYASTENTGGIINEQPLDQILELPIQTIQKDISQMDDDSKGRLLIEALKEIKQMYRYQNIEE